MSLKFEKINALNRTKEFMRDLLDPKKTPRIPKKYRLHAYRCLKHFPWECDIIIRDDDGQFRLPERKKGITVFGEDDLD